MKITRIIENSGQVTALFRERTYLWIGYILSGQARLRKVSAYDTSLIFYDGVINADKILRIRSADTSDIFLVLDSTTYIGAAVPVDYPTSIKYAPKPTGISRNAVDVTFNNYYAYYIILGIESSIPAKLTHGYLSGTNQPYGIYDLTLGGTTIYTPSAVTRDENSHLWIVTYTNPVQLVKVTLGSGGVPTISLIKDLG